jgi:hypothetical protein
MFPSADDFARALVAACRETGEDPEAFVVRDPDFRARHYALHALIALFPRAWPTKLSELLGCPGQPGYFLRSSLWWVIGLNPQRRPGKDWWDHAALDRVTAAVRARLVVVEAPPRVSTARPASTLSPALRAPPRPAPVEPDDAPRWRTPDPAPRPLPPPEGSKRSLQEMLREAVENTAKLQKEQP